MLFLDELDQTLERVAKTLQQMIRRRMVSIQFFQHFARLPVGVDFPGNTLELRLVFTQIRIPDLQQPGQGRVDHLVVE